MPSGRHRHSPPLHKILPPSAVAGVSVVLAVAAWLVAEPLPLRLLVAAAAATGLAGAYLMRSWDRAAGLRVAELERARAGDAWRAEERVAELEQELEEAHEVRTRLEAKLRRKRVELAGLRGEHAGLLRRYANAETERASALEGRRQLAIEAAVQPRELLAARSTPTPAAYLRAAEALAGLSRNAGLQEARRRADEARRRDLAERAQEERVERDRSGTGAASGRHAAASARPEAPAVHAPAADVHPAPGRVPQQALPSSGYPQSPLPPLAPGARTVPGASSVVPYAAARRHLVPQGTFDFFGTQKQPAAIESVQEEDLADVVGEEALADHRDRDGDRRAVGQVIDLAHHDEADRRHPAPDLRRAIS
ncbi:hypothetical protein [uncultured Streptomyces sp.]|uniref:hypothetical protein n=1 Tax=uncultured Streptomyces sp. TaxID=174707 RepID=UPI00262E4A2B|nr:hypothetical protein [uncultured Streptomyces sp.]